MKIALPTPVPGLLFNREHGDGAGNETSLSGHLHQGKVLDQRPWPQVFFQRSASKASGFDCDQQGNLCYKWRGTQTAPASSCSTPVWGISLLGEQVQLEPAIWAEGAEFGNGVSCS